MRSIVARCCLLFLTASGLSGAVQWREGFELGALGWTIEGATWEFGPPTATTGPKAFAGTGVAGTVLAGNYGGTHDARLITPPFVVPPAGDAPRLAFHSWYQIGANDYAQVQIRVGSGAWQDVAGMRFTEAITSWSRHAVDLRGYAGQPVQLAFRFVATFGNRVGDLALGWYLDEAALETGPMTLAAPEDFESGFGDWSVDGGVWQVGTPAGPGAPAAFTGAAVAGTTLVAHYGTAHDARLISPEFVVPAASQAPRFAYHYWYSIGGLDHGQVQVRTAGGAWQDVPGGRLTESAKSWARGSVDLRAFAGQTVQVGFRLVSRFEIRRGDTGLGWFIDAAGLEAGPAALAAPEGFENGFGAWSVENGVWQVGRPAMPGGPVPLAGTAVAGTALTGNYGTTHDARLVSPEFAVPAAAAYPRFAYSYWYAFGGGDHGQLQIRTVGGAWQDVTGERLTGTGGAWARRSVDLRAFAGQAVQLGFRLVTTFNNYRGDSAPGWFIDEARLETGPMTFAPPEGFEGGFGHWSAEGGVWQVGAPAGAGRPAAFAGTGVAGTMLRGSYPDNADARLVSPEFVVPPALRAPQLEWQQWHAILNRDRGTIEVSVAGGAWTPLGHTTTGSSGGWKPAALDLAPLAGKPVRIAFRLTSDRWFGSGGWYLDELRLGTVDPTTLALGQAVDGLLPVAGARALYALDAPPDGHLRFTLDDLDDVGANEIYVRRGSLPTAGQYDRRFNAAGADQTLFVPNAGAGPWFVLVIGATVPNGGSAFRIRADFSSGIALNRVTPARVGNGAPATLDLEGAGFAGGARVELRSGSTVAAAGTATVLALDRLRADLPLANVAPGTYDVVVTQGTHSAALPLEITAGGVPKFEARLFAPGRLGRHALATLYVEYANTGTVAMPPPLLAVRGTDGALLTLDAAYIGRGFRVLSNPLGFDDVVQFLASGDTPGVLQPGERKRVAVYYCGLAKPWNMRDSNLQFDLGLVERTNTDAINWPGFKAQVRPHHLQSDAWDVIWQNFITAAGPTWGDYVGFLIAQSTFLGATGARVTDVRDLMRYALAQADGLTLVPTPVSATDTRLEQPGFALEFHRIHPAATSQRHRTGALGRGWSHNWEYTLVAKSDGAKSLLGPAGVRRDFQPLAGGGYLSDEGDHAVLRAVRGGTFELREPDGLKRVFHADGRLDRVEDLNGNRVTADYAGSQLVRLTHSGGAKLDLAYSGTLLQSVTDSAGGTTRFDYDAAGHLVRATGAGGAAESYAYEARTHALTRVTYADGRTADHHYDAAGRLASLPRHGAVVRLTYDQGSVTLHHAAGGATAFRFDHLGNLARIVDALGRQLDLARDRDSNLLALTTPDGSVTRITPDRRGQPVRVVDALGRAVTFTWHPAGRVQSFTDARNHMTRFVRTAAGETTSVIDPGRSLTRATRDPQGELLTLTNRRGQTVTVTRDAAGRIARKALPDGRTFDCQYDARGNLVAVADSATGTTTLTYDARDRLTAVRQADGRGFSYAYDAADRRTARTSHDGHVVRYAYDSAGRLAKLEDGTGRTIVAYDYDADGRLARENKGNGTATTYTYDAAGQLLQLVNHAADGAVASRFDSSYDAAGRRTSLATLAGTTRYTYDAIGQLTGVTHPDGRDARYTYDAAGNRMEAWEGGPGAAYTANPLNQYTHAGPARFTYDADGNLTQRTDGSGVTTFAYDSENRLVRVVSPTDGSWTFAYDAFGNRITATRNGVAAHFVPDLTGLTGLTDIAAEYDGAGSLVARYDHGHGLAQRVAADGTRAFYNFDPVGHTRELTDGTGGIANRYDYDPFGAFRLRQETVPNRFTYVGRAGVMNGPAGLFHMRRRDYDPVHGRFTTRDPLGIEGDYNLYRYAFNAPTMYIDPSGEVPFLVVVPFLAGCGWLIHHAIHEIGDFRYRQQMFHNVDNPQAMIDLEKQRTSRLRELQKKGSELVGKIAGDASIMPTSLEYFFTKTIWKFLGKYLLDIPWQFLTNLWQQIVAAVDPNELIGPAGHGPANHLRGDQSFAYRLNFENDRSATAPAQVVEIVNALPAGLDPASVELTSVGFGDIVVPIPAGSQRFEHTERVAWEETGFDVQIEVVFDPEAREVRATFTSLMPDSGLPPPVEVGFLPPEDDTGRGQGHLAYVVRPVAALTTDTEIRNIGLITFDRLAGGPTFRTDLSNPRDPNSAPSPARQALVTIDADAPASRVAALPAETTGDTVIVAWTGTDRGAGIVSHDLYVRTDGGPWRRWQQATSETAASWKGEYGRRYGFFSAATDGAGFSEPPPAANAAAQAETVLRRPLWQNAWLWAGLAAGLGGLAMFLKRRRA